MAEGTATPVAGSTIGCSSSLPRPCSTRLRPRRSSRPTRRLHRVLRRPSPRHRRRVAALVEAFERLSARPTAAQRTSLYSPRRTLTLPRSAGCYRPPNWSQRSSSAAPASRTNRSSPKGSSKPPRHPRSQPAAARPSSRSCRSARTGHGPLDRFVRAQADDAADRGERIDELARLLKTRGGTRKAERATVDPYVVELDL